MSEKPRMAEVDVLKGMLVVTVVLGHAIQQYGAVLGDFWSAVETLVYSFHMPAFVFVSGFCVWRSLEPAEGRPRGRFLRNRALRLIVPYLTWGVLYFALRAFFGGYARIPYDYGKLPFFLLGYNPDGAMWFVWALFAATVAASLAVWCLGAWRALALAAALAVLHPYVCPGSGAPARALCAVPPYMFFLLLGTVCRERFARYAQAGRIHANLPLAGFALLFVIACWLNVNRIAHPAPWYLLTSVSATFLLFGLAHVLMGRCRAVQTVFALLGAEAMAIYVLGEPIKVACRIVMSGLGVPVTAAFPAMIVLVLVLSVASARVLRRFEIVRKLLLGEGWR